MTAHGHHSAHVLGFFCGPRAAPDRHLTSGPLNCGVELHSMESRIFTQPIGFFFFSISPEESICLSFQSEEFASSPRDHTHTHTHKQLHILNPLLI